MLSHLHFSVTPSDCFDRISRWWPTEAADALRLSVTSPIAMYLAMYFELDEPLLGGMTVFSVSLATRASSIQKSTWRAFSTILGAAVSIVLMDNLAQFSLA
jgi:uncharacterized membrane protein YgaE (UPF0421/DUF939 family)